MMRQLTLMAATCALSAGTLNAQSLRLYSLAADVSLDGMIVVLDVPAAWQREAQDVDIVWDTPAGQRHFFSAPARAGKHAYDPRADPRWHGPARWVSSNVPGKGMGEFKFPSLGDEADIFLTPEYLQPATVNVLRGHRFFDFAWDMLLLLLAALAALAFYFVTRCPPAVALVAGFVLAWVALDLRTIVDHVAIVQTLENNDRTMPGLADAYVFADRATPLIGSATWACDRSLDADPLAAHLFGYAFAEQPYLPAEDANKADFVVTRAPPRGKALWQHGPYSLLRREAP
jgi:hypothetical protein